MSTLDVPIRTRSGIPLRLNQLAHNTGAYTAFVVSLIDLRKRLRAERKKHFGNSRAAAKAAGLGASTVAKIENINSYPNYDPGVGTVEQLLKPMGLTLSAFFLQIERQTDADSTSPRQRDTNQPSHQLTGQPMEAADDARAGVRSDPAVVGEVLYDLADVLSEAAKRITASAHQRSTGPSTRRPEGTTRRGGARGKKTG